MHDITTVELAERAAAGNLTAEELALLQERKAADPAFAQKFDEYYNLVNGLGTAGRNRRFRSMLSEIGTAKAAPKRAARILALPYFRTAAVAAGVAILASSVTITMMQRHQPKVTNVGVIQDLRRKVIEIEGQQQRQQQDIATIKDLKETGTPAPLPASQYGGTGFALTNDGYIITSYHVADGADSLYVQTRSGRNYKAHIVAFEPRTDVAVLKIENEHFRFGMEELPYTFATSRSPLGARIYSLGFPQDEIVYNEGYIASRNGYEGDSAQYRLEIAAGPGQSGAPVADEHGNIVGIIKSKDLQSEGTTYAVTSRTLLRLLRDLPKTMKLNLPHANHLAGLSREAQIETLQDYTCVIKVYGK